MKTFVCSFLFGMISVSGAFAAETSSQVEAKGSNEVIVPSYFDENAVPKQTGSIFYDLDLGAFRGVNQVGGLDTLSPVVGTVTSSGSNERTERAYISGNVAGTIDISSGNLVVSSQSGAWLSGLSYTSAGDYVLNFPGIFTGRPACTCSSDVTTVSNDLVCGMFYSTGVSTSINVRITTAGSQVNPRGFWIICQGERG